MIISILLGFLIGRIIMLITKPSTINHGPDSNEIKKLTYKDQFNQCYQFRPQSYICPLYLLRNRHL